MRSSKNSLTPEGGASEGERLERSEEMEALRSAEAAAEAAALAVVMMVVAPVVMAAAAAVPQRQGRLDGEFQPSAQRCRCSLPAGLHGLPSARRLSRR